MNLEFCILFLHAQEKEDLYRETDFLRSRLIVNIIKNSPIIDGKDITVFIETNYPVRLLHCRFNDEEYKDCKSLW